MKICSDEKCTACGACGFSCPKNAIVMQENQVGVVYPVVNESLCIQCGRCRKICPQINLPEFYNPKKVYAAWSADQEERRTSASGGIAAEIYKSALEQQVSICGAKLNSDFSVSFELGDNVKDIEKFKNSKYVFSTMYEIYPQLRKLLKAGGQAVVIGLPCQIAAIRNLFPNEEKLLLVDLVCHGTTSFSYLKQHISWLETKFNDHAVKMSFRDPYKHTYTYTFTLYNKMGEQFYAQRTKDGDTYQFGYHRMISYRENCYNCSFAKEKRISDITLSDYKGLGKLSPCDFGEQKVSNVMIHTNKGEIWISDLIKQGHIIAEERPIREPILGDAQLQHPSEKSRARLDFQKYIQYYNGDFEKTMRSVLRKEAKRELSQKILSFARKIKNKISR